ncbi:mitochondrial inner membrane translocase subunit Tim17/Tim22/Tim23/peroxisomal protein PMP24 [Tribonema minus]|uniref:Mitochondrial import inner membrane translocase subunit TIM22 n=1 Tax=Tribonema minus TaxID=303371 RepID=A0A835ZDR4_9STRA|nr:mitochondrial inner membrane translocase subunit Tim17/Tim22/Tim23/peroxisomal protein PMP24 [Tribonema minus]
MEEPPDSGPACSATAVEGLVRGSVFGAVWGLVVTPVDRRLDDKYARSMGKPIHRTKMQLFKRAAAGTATSTLAFGVVCGLYSGITCSVAKYRGKQDWINQAVAGCVGGACLGYGRGPRDMALYAVGTAALTTILHFAVSRE